MFRMMERSITAAALAFDNLAITGNTHTKLVSESLTTAGNVQFTQSYYGSTVKLMAASPAGSSDAAAACNWPQVPRCVLFSRLIQQPPSSRSHADKQEDDVQRLDPREQG